MLLNIDVKADESEIEFQRSFMAKRISIVPNGTAKGNGADYHKDRIVEVDRKYH